MNWRLDRQIVLLVDNRVAHQVKCQLKNMKVTPNHRIFCGQTIPLQFTKIYEGVLPKRRGTKFQKEK